MESHTDVWHMIGFLSVMLVVLFKDRLQNSKHLAMTEAHIQMIIKGSETQILERLQALEVRLQVQEQRKIPPDWFESKVDNLEKAMHELTKNCIAHRERT